MRGASVRTRDSAVGDGAMEDQKGCPVPQDQQIRLAPLATVLPDVWL